MALFKVTENDKKVYEEELRDFLPEKILDVHTHIFLKELETPPPPGTVQHDVVSWPGLVARDNSVEDLQETYRLMFPGKDVKALMFAGGDGSEANSNYISECSKRTGWPALYYSVPEQSADEIEEKIRTGGFLGLKSYYGKSPKYIPTNEVRIFDFFPRHQLERLNEMGGIVMLHIPRDKRLKDPVNLAQILEIKRDFPKVRLIIAHVGRAYVKSDIGNAFDVLAEAPDLMYDFCANSCDAAIEAVIKNAGVKHVMFGTDMPVLRMRCRRIEENNTYINLIPPGLYGDPNQDSHLREVSPEEADKITFFAYEELLAFKRVAEKLNLSRQDIEDIMYNNAMNLIEGARRDIYGE